MNLKDKNENLNPLENLINKKSQVTDNISNLYKEIKKEEKINEIKEKTDNKFWDLFNRNLPFSTGNSSSPLELFRQIKKLVQQRKEGRGRRSTTEEILNPEERKNLQKFYELYVHLVFAKKEIFEEFKKLVELTDQLSVIDAKVDTKSLRQIIIALKKLNWDGSALKANLSENVKDLEYFYGDFKKANEAILQLTQKQEKIRDQLNLVRRSQLHFIGHNRDRWSNAFRKKAWSLHKLNLDSSGDIQFVIASKLLNLMGQLQK